MSIDYRKSHLETHYGEAYHRKFYENTYRSIVWQLEKVFLDSIVHEFYRGHKIRHLDFACGTGRILKYLENRTVRSLGVDLSSSMLEVAKKNLKRSEIINADITRDDVLGDCKFNLITAFRFFPNAQPQLRLESMAVLVKHLDTDGFIVFNNHKNLSSLTCRSARLFRIGGKHGMHFSEVERLLTDCGLKIEKAYHVGVMPSTENHLLLPRPLLYSLERCLSTFKMFRNFAQNVIFVCKRAV